jgi:hypothetical protein
MIYKLMYSICRSEITCMEIGFAGKEKENGRVSKIS